jgi:predicted GNAT family N-acyltransferase
MCMNRPSPFVVRAVHWVTDGSVLRAIRTEVFVHEQMVPAELERDAQDERAWHVLATTPDGAIVGTGRLLRDGHIGHIGRMAVLRPWRGQGAGGALLTELLRIAAEAGLKELALNAQTHAIAFYARFGFVPEGETFLEAGIPHLGMRRRE